jgi:vesicle coat complex subunit
VLDRLSVNLSHGNPGIVLSTIRIIVKFMDYLLNNDVIRNYCSKVTQTLITMIGNSDHEFKYIVLKNINIIIQKRPLILSREIKIFFCSHNDPHYVKIEKLEVLLRLADDETIDPILMELKEYVTEVDIDFVRKCIRTFGRLAIKLEQSSDICVQALFECLKTKVMLDHQVNYVIQEAIIVMRDIFRRYPNKYESILVELCKNLSSIDEPEAKSAMIWIIGEYIEIIANANKLLGTYLEGFKEETTDVQLQIMTSCIKLLIIRPQEGGPLVKSLFSIIEESDNPDLRDRGYFYWRMLGKNREVASNVVSAHKPPISDMSYNFESNLLEKLVDGISSLTAIYYKEPEAFVKILRESKNQKWEEQEEDGVEEVVDSTGGKMGTYLAQVQNNDYGMQNSKDAGPAGPVNLLGDDGPQKQTPPQQNRPTNQMSTPFDNDADLLSDSNSQAPQPTFSNIKIPMSTVGYCQ